MNCITYEFVAWRGAWDHEMDDEMDDSGTFAHSSTLLDRIVLLSRLDFRLRLDLHCRRAHDMTYCHLWFTNTSHSNLSYCTKIMLGSSLRDFLSLLLR